jgi:hypothetical protein
MKRLIRIFKMIKFMRTKNFVYLGSLRLKPGFSTDLKMDTKTR